METNPPLLSTLNLAPNASPLTQVTVELLRRSAQEGFDPRVCRIRDSWLREDGRVALCLHLGGELRGGANSALWYRIRQHPAYVADEDCPEIMDHAVVVFRILNYWVLLAAQELVDNVPAVSVTAEQKQRDTFSRALKREVPPYTAKVSHEQVQVMCAAYVAAVLKYCMDPA